MFDGSLAAPRSGRTSLLLLVALLVGSPALGKFDDTVFLNNGDRILGDVKELHRDLLRYKTDSMGEVYIRWADIRSIETTKQLRIELKSGRRLVGSLARADAAEQILIATRRQDELHQLGDVVAFVPLKLQLAWFDRLDGSVKFGLNGTKGSNTLQWNLGANALYRGENWEISTRWDSIVTDKSDDTSSERILFTTSYRRLLSNRWFWTLIGSYDRNDELGVLNRYGGGGGVGRFLMRSNSFELMFQAGLLAIHEDRVDADGNQLEGYLGGQVAWFRHRFPKTDIKTDLVVFPSFSDSGRYRTQLDLSVSREFITDLFLDLSFYYATDNQAPEEAGRSDWGVVTSVEYSF